MRISPRLVFTHIAEAENDSNVFVSNEFATKYKIREKRCKEDVSYVHTHLPIRYVRSDEIWKLNWFCYFSNIEFGKLFEKS